MASTAIVFAMSLLDILPTAIATAAWSALTIALTFALYLRSVHLGQVDEALVILAVVAWTITLGLMSL